MTQLTQREHEVLQLAVRGMSNDEIAASLAISRRTVEAHIRTLFRKTGVTRRSQLVALDQRDDRARTEPSASGQVRADGDRAAGFGRRLELPEHERRLRRYAAAVRGLTDRQFALFEERVELTIVVGEHDEQDTVIERRWTRPKPYLVYRILRPIVARTDGPPVDPEDLALVCDVAGQDIQGDVQAMQDEASRPLVMVLFQPGLQAETEWVLCYHSPGLWTPLRNSGEDTLNWATTTFDQRHRPNINELVLKVQFPPRWTHQQLTEQNNLGTVDTARLPGGQHQLTWYHRTPVAAAYHWVLRGSPEDSTAE